MPEPARPVGLCNPGSDGDEPPVRATDVADDRVALRGLELHDERRATQPQLGAGGRAGIVGIHGPADAIRGKGGVVSAPILGRQPEMARPG